MNTSSLPRQALALAAALTTTSLFALAPAVRAQQPPPPPPPPPAAAPTPPDQADIFDAIKKGADKLQKEARKTQNIEPQLRQLAERQDEFMRAAGEAKKQLEAQQKEVLTELTDARKQLAKQQEELARITRLLEHMEAQHHAMEERQESRHQEHVPFTAAPDTSPSTDGTPRPNSPLPATEPPAASAAPTPGA